MKEVDFYFKGLKNKSVHLYDYCNRFIDSANEKEMIEHYSFRGYFLDNNEVIAEPIIAKINEQFPIEFGGIGYIYPHTVYDYHIDFDRRVAINMFLRGGKSHSIFKGDYYEDTPLFEFKELTYEPKTFYLYNTGRRHSVINFDKKRWVFSVRFKNGELTYNEVFDWCKENNMLETTQNK